MSETKKIPENIRYESLRIRPRGQGGADWRSERVVIARVEYTDGKVAELWWWRAGTSWTGRLEGYTPYPASLVVATPSSIRGCGHPCEVGGAGTQTWKIHEGGRLGRPLLRAKSEEIERRFGFDLGPLLDPRRTVIVTGIERKIPS